MFHTVLALDYLFLRAICILDVFFELRLRIIDGIFGHFEHIFIVSFIRGFSKHLSSCYWFLFRFLLANGDFDLFLLRSLESSACCRISRSRWLCSDSRRSHNSCDHLPIDHFLVILSWLLITFLFLLCSIFVWLSTFICHLGILTVNYSRLGCGCLSVAFSFIFLPILVG